MFTCGSDVLGYKSRTSIDAKEMYVEDGCGDDDLVRG